MSTASAYPHLTVDATGCVRIGDSRYTVQHLAAEHYQHGWSADELLRQHPDLRPEEVYAALTYFYDHYESLTAALHESVKSLDNRDSKAFPISRQELLSRKAARGN